MSGLLGNFSFLAIVSFAEIIQFLCLFSLISLIKYPNILNPLFNSQNIWNFNFITLPDLSFLNCSGLFNDEKLDYNYNNHPSLSGINFICNSFSVVLSIIAPFIIYVMSSLILLYFCRQLKNSFNWNGFIQIINSSLNVVMVLALIQFQYVKIKQESIEINVLNIISYLLSGIITVKIIRLYVSHF